MNILFCISLVALFGSFLVNQRKTKVALITAGKRLVHIVPTIFIMLALIACLPVHALISGLFDVINHVNGAWGIAAAVLIGSVTMLPGFIVFPLSGVFAQKAVPFFILSAWTTSMMMVGIVTFPLEKTYLGTKLALVRNLIGFVIAVTVAGITGLVFTEF